MVYRNECITVKRKEGRVEKKISLFKYAAGITVSTLFLDGFFSMEKEIAVKTRIDKPCINAKGDR